ncbi:hypothetical protein LZQ00_10040 [Sphingobacterium sp. SRCM116780]|uniref:hypothetical protein n=1 Tax=Sphingobacterium sp. SRCM116780 TaxID=2907623 RepID=UPI001F36105F|nr:hypothetical protein [Sphingobacterium sp. SRCM116780]UIR54614.1 hypothetical protein LZQ00_10040 [Sphingobacterium sp. SRCM116780]
MKNKAMTYVLLAAVIGLWGYILMQVFNSLSSDSTIPTTGKRTFGEQEMNLSFYKTKNTGALLLNYSDPMLRNQTHEELTEPLVVESNTAIDTYVAPQPYEPVPQIDVQYLGYIENLVDKRPTAIIQIEGKQYMMNNGEHQSGMKLVSMTKEYIKIKIDNMIKTIYKNEN